MRDRIIEAVKTSIIKGVEWAVRIALVAWLTQDYLRLRSNSLYGKAAQEWILAGIQAGKLPAEWKPAAPSADPLPSGTMAPTAGPLPVPLASPPKAK